VAIEVPRITHDRAVLHAGLAAVALTEWASIHGLGLFRSSGQAALVGVVWALVVLALGESRTHQPHAVELLSVAVVAVVGSLVVGQLSGAGSYYLYHTHPVGSLLASVWTVAFPAGLGYAGAVGSEWFGEWARLRRTTPEERVLQEPPEL
jgi:hypothetical protein